ncbi:MerR family transcriptional regulator [Aeromicrobium sp. CF3.5]|uniref:MerR family transcriptional regulator n=1 Tax=Aeromicrobium sp. CF3.5 TaxID=3373078 RepID=UPI003EE7841D
MMNIGDFSRATRLSAKALRHYHRLGLLEPAFVDDVTGYRSYAAEQVTQAHLIRHFRSLEMPLDIIGRILAADSPDHRSQLIAQHLQVMEERLTETRDAVTALRSLLDAEHVTAVIERRQVGETPALVLRDHINLSNLGVWFTDARAELDRALTSTRAAPSGPMGGLWSTDLILDEAGEVALFHPVSVDPQRDDAGRVRFELLPAVLLAVATHSGPDATVGQVYADLGQHVARHETGADGPVREIYLAGVPGGEGVTEIGWPIQD